MSRIVEITTETVRKEAISPFIGIHWNRDNTGYIEFWVQQEISVNGQYVSTEQDRRGTLQPLRVNISDLLPRTFMVPNPNGDPYAVPCMLLMGAIKQAFDDIYSEWIMQNEVTPTPTPSVTLEITPEPTPESSFPEPEPTPEPTPTPSVSG